MILIRGYIGDYGILLTSDFYSNYSATYAPSTILAFSLAMVKLDYSFVWLWFLMIFFLEMIIFFFFFGIVTAYCYSYTLLPIGGFPWELFYGGTKG
jgi:hypothetical protein